MRAASEANMKSCRPEWPLPGVACRGHPMPYSDGSTERHGYPHTATMQGTLNVRQSSLPPRMRRPGGAAACLVILLLGLAAALEGDIPEAFGDAWQFLLAIGHGHRELALVGLLYLEESGAPLPIPGDVVVMYLGHRLPAAAGSWSMVWLLLVLAVVGGASNLYLVARRWGPAIAGGRLGRLLRLTPERLAWAQRWFTRWGPWALILGRHVPGGRVPLTLVAGLFGMSYPVFAGSVAVSAAVWAAFFLAVGRHLGPRVATLLHAHRSTYLILPLGIVLAVLLYLLHRFLGERQAKRRR